MCHLCRLDGIDDEDPARPTRAEADADERAFQALPPWLKPQPSSSVPDDPWRLSQEDRRRATPTPRA